MPTKAKPYISPSRLDMFERCGEQYRRRYVEGEILPPGILLITGKSTHAGIELNMEQKIDSHEDLPADEVKDMTAEDFDAQVKGGYELTAEESGRGAKKVLGEAKDTAVKLSELHMEEAAPEYQPTHVEHKVRIEMPTSEYDLFGVIDLIDDRDRVTDHKTAGKSKNQSEADTSTQLTYYAAGHHALKGKGASEVRLDVLVKTKTPKRQLLVSQRGEKDFEVLANRLNRMIAAVKAGTFVPAPAGSWQCSDRFCGYARSCPFYVKR